jgi:hypothetical protein
MQVESNWIKILELNFEKSSHNSDVKKNNI